VAVWKSNTHRLIEKETILKYPAVPRGAQFVNRRANLFLDTRAVWLYEKKKSEKKKKIAQHSTADGKVKVIGSCEPALSHL